MVLFVNGDLLPKEQSSLERFEATRQQVSNKLYALMCLNLVFKSSCFTGSFIELSIPTCLEEGIYTSGH